MNKSTKINYFEYIIVATLAVLFMSGVTTYSYYSFRNLDKKKIQLTSELEATIKSSNIATYQPQIGEIKELISESDLVGAKLLLMSLTSDIYIVEKRAEIVAKRAEAEKLVAEKKAVEEKAKLEEASRLAATKKPTTNIYRAPIVAAESCSKSELYVVINVQNNTEKVWRGDPDCRTGEPIEDAVPVATGAHTTYWNPGGWSYWAATPAGKWKIISKEYPSDPQFGGIFLRLHYLAGGYVDEYALHGTNDPNSIGNHASHGCIRHHNDRIGYLNSILQRGTTVWTE